jgi:hypothetical protein
MSEKMSTFKITAIRTSNHNYDMLNMNTLK